MTIEKNDKVYMVRENKQSWTISIKFGQVDVVYNVPKAGCPTFDDLKEFIVENEMF